MSQPKVFLYALSTCGHCRNTKKFLDEKGVNYSFVDVDLAKGDEQKEIIAKVQKYNPQLSFPTILIGDGDSPTVIIGFRQDEIIKAIGL